MVVRIHWEAPIYSHGRTTEICLISSLSLSHCMYICFSASKMNSLLLDIRCIMILGTVLLNSGFLPSTEKNIEGWNIFSCKELEVLETKRKCGRNNITESFQVPRSYLFSVQSRQELHEWIRELIHISQKVELTINVKEQIMLTRLLKTRKCGRGIAERVHPKSGKSVALTAKSGRG